MEKGVKMKLFTVLFCFFTIFSYGAPECENLVKVTINIGSKYVTAYVNLSTSENLNSFFIIGEEV